jgi:hypothetical protein
LGPAPSTPVDDVPVITDEVVVPVTAGPVSPVRICTPDDVLITPTTGFDVVPCRVIETVNIVAPCESALDHVRSVPLHGNTVADTLLGATGAVDSLITDALDVPPIVVPPGTIPSAVPPGTIPPGTLERADELADPVRSIQWGSKSTDLVARCETLVQAVGSAVALNNSQVFAGVNVNIPVCPFPELIPVCDNVVFNNGTVQDLQGTRIPLVTNSCTVKNLIADCGDLADFGNPLEPTHEIVESLTPNANVTADSSQHLNQSTPGISEAAATARSGVVGCTLGGVPPNSGVLPGTYGGSVTAQPNGGQLPLGLEDTLLFVFQTVTAPVNAEVASANAATSSALNSAIATINSNWNNPLIRNNVHPTNSGHPSHTNCAGTSAPTVEDIEVPGVEGPSAQDVLDSLPLPGGENAAPAIAALPSSATLGPLELGLPVDFLGVTAKTAPGASGVPAPSAAFGSDLSPEVASAQANPAAPRGWLEQAVDVIAGLMDMLVAALAAAVA